MSVGMHVSVLWLLSIIFILPHSLLYFVVLLGPVLAHSVQLAVLAVGNVWVVQWTVQMALWRGPRESPHHHLQHKHEVGIPLRFLVMRLRSTNRMISGMRRFIVLLRSRGRHSRISALSFRLWGTGKARGGDISTHFWAGQSCIAIATAICGATSLTAHHTTFTRSAIGVVYRATTTCWAEFLSIARST